MASTKAVKKTTSDTQNPKPVQPPAEASAQQQFDPLKQTIRAFQGLYYGTV